MAKKLISHTFSVKFRVFRREFLRNHSVYWAQIFRDNWNCYALSIFRVFILLASSDSDKHMLMRQKVQTKIRLLTKFVLSRWLDTGLVLFCVFIDRDQVEVNKNAIKNLANIQPSWLHFRSIERRSVTSRSYGSTISLWQQNQRRRRRQAERQKIMFMLTKNNFARASRYFVHFFAVVAPLRHETS